MYKVVKADQGSVRQISKNKSANNLITKDVSPNVSLATTGGKEIDEREVTEYDRIYYVLSGEFVLQFADGVNHLSVGDACFITKDTEYGMSGTFEVVVINQPAFGS